MNLAKTSRNVAGYKKGMGIYMNLLTMTGISKAFTDKVLFHQVDFSIAEGEKIGIIGVNGTGKSTLLKIIAGIEHPDEGEITKGNKVYIRFLEQNPYFEPGITIYDYVVKANIHDGNEYQIEGEAKSILNRFGFENIQEKIEVLSGGQKKKVALAGALLSNCDILILDEPTNHLDNDMTAWLEEYLMKWRGAFVMVTHDRYFLDRVSNRIVEIDKGNLYSYKTNYSGFLTLKAEREEMQLATERKRQSILRTELEWIMRGARARSTKQKARIERFEEMKEKKGPTEEIQVEMNSVSSRMGKKTIEVSHISKSFGNKEIVKDFSYIFLKGDRIGIIGPNGSGKTTLMKMIYGALQPDEGTIEIGTTVKLGYFSQENEYMDENMRVIDYIRDVAEYVTTTDGTISASQMLERFLFDGTLQYSLIKKLSGGEKRRLYLLRVLMDAPNVLMLDEPTNDLDIRTLTILEDYLDSFDGIVITVSHDRYFLDRVVRRIFAYEGHKLVQYEGGYTDYMANRPEVDSDVTKKTTKDVEDKEQVAKTQKVRDKKLKFTYAEQKEFDSIDEDILKLEERLEEIEKEMVTNATNYSKLNELTDEKTKTEETLEYKMDRWVYLNDLNEQILNQ